MTESVKQRLVQADFGGPTERELQALLAAVQADLAHTSDRLASQTVATAGLVITATAGLKVPKIGAADCYAVANGTAVKIAAGTDMPALVGSVTNAKFNVFCFYVDSAGTVTSAMGTEGATLAAVAWPATPSYKAIVGFIIVNPTGTGNFVGGTTALNDGTVIPNTAYVSPVGAFDPKTALNTNA